MRITLLNQYYAPDEAATAQMLADVGLRLAAAGHDVTAICSDRSYGEPHRRYKPIERIDGVLVRRVRTTAFGRSSKLGRLIDYVTFLVGAARRLLFSARPDVVLVLTTPPMLAWVVLTLRPLRAYRIVFWSMDVYPEVAFELGVIRPSSAAGRLLERISRSVLRGVDVVIALGETMAERLRAAGASRVTVIHNWADEDAIRPLTAIDRGNRAHWGWTRRMVILYSGNLGLAHEFDTVLEAARRLAQPMPNVLFAFIGVGPRLEEVRRAAAGLPNVEFRDYVERAKLGESLTAADVHLVTLRPSMPGLLVPSKIYGILAAGRPTLYVGPSRGEVFDILTEGSCGTVVANGDVDALLKAIREYAFDPFRRDREGLAARRIFEERFTRRKNLDSFLALLEHTVSGSDPSVAAQAEKTLGDGRGC